MPPPQGQNPFAQGQNAYGQQPPPPQGGYGYPPQQGAAPQGGYGYPPQQGAPLPNQGGIPMTNPTPPQARKKKAIARLVIAAVVIIGGVCWGLYQSKDAPASAAVGDCVHRGSDNDNNPELKVVDCTSTDAQYEVMAKIKGTFLATLAEDECKKHTNDFEYTYTETGGSGDDFLLCLKTHKA